jgi:hypothetical protein
MDGSGARGGSVFGGGAGLDLMPKGSRNDFRSDKGVDMILGHGFVDTVFVFICEAAVDAGGALTEEGA